MPGLLDFRKLWPNDFAMEPQPVYADKEAERAGQLLKDAAQQKYGEPDPTFSFSHLSDYLANAGEAAGKAAGLPQYSEANPPPWAEGAASHAPQAAPNITAEDITSGRWGNSGGIAGSIRKAATDVANMVPGQYTDLKDALTGGSPVSRLQDLGDAALAPAKAIAGSGMALDQATGARITGPVFGSFLDQSGQMDTNLGNLPGNIAHAAVQANPVARITGSILSGGGNPYGGEANTQAARFQESNAPAGLKVAQQFATPLGFAGGGEAIGTRKVLQGLAGGAAAAQGAQLLGAPEGVQQAVALPGAILAAEPGLLTAIPRAGVKLNELINERIPVGERSAASDRVLNRLIHGAVDENGNPLPPAPLLGAGEDTGGLHAPGLASEHPTASELGGPAPEAPGKPPLSAEQELIQKAIRSSEQMDPQRQAELRSLRAAQGSGYYNEYKTALERTGDPALAHDIATQATAGTAGFTQAADTIPSASVPTLREQVLAARERDVNPINDFEMRRANIMLSEAEQNGSRALGPQNERDLWAKIVGLSPEGDVHFPISDVKYPAPTMTLPGFDLPPQSPLPNPNDPFRPPAAAPAPDYAGAGPQPPDRVFNTATGKWEPKPAETPATAPAPPQSPIGNPDVPVQGQGIVATDSGLHVAGTEPGAIPVTTPTLTPLEERTRAIEARLGIDTRTTDEITAARTASEARQAENVALADRAAANAEAGKALSPDEYTAWRASHPAPVEPGSAAPKTGWAKSWDAFANALNLPIAMKAGLDVSYMLRQGLPILAGNPTQAPAAFKAMKAALRDPEAYAQWRRSILDDPWYSTIMDKTKLHLGSFGEHEEQYASGFAQKIKPFAVSERANTAWLDTLRYNVAKQSLKNMIAREAAGGAAVTDRELSQLGEVLSHGSGRGTGAALDLLGRAQVSPMFSARNLMSKPQLLTDMIRTGGEARSQAIRQMVGYGVVVGGFDALAAAAGAEVGFDRDPRGLFGVTGGNFTRAKFGANSIDLSGGFGGNIRSVAQMIDSSIQRDPTKTLDTAIRFGRGKLSPTFGFLADNLVFQANYDQTPIDWKSFGGVATQLNNLFGTLSVNDIVNAAKANDVTTPGGALSTFALGALALLGAGLNSGLSPSEQRMEARDAATQRLFPGQKYDDLLASDKAKINQDPTVKGFDSQVQNAPGSKIGEATLAFDKTMQDARDNFTTTKPDGSIAVTDGVGYRKAFQDAAKTRHDFLAGAGVGEGKDDVLNGWYALYNAPGIQKQLQAKDYSGIDALQEQYTAAHPEIVDKLAKSVGAKDDPVMQQMRAAAAEAKQYYAIPKYRGLSEQDATTADKILAKAASMVNNRQAGSQAAALAALVRDGYYSPEQVGLARRASALPTNPERKQFQLSHPLFATFYKGADSSLGDVGAAGAGTTGGLSGGLGGGLTGGLR